MIAPVRHVPEPRIHEALLVYLPQQYVGYDRANPRVQVPCEGLTDYGARLDAAIKLRVPADRVHVRLALPGSGAA